MEKQDLDKEALIGVILKQSNLTDITAVVTAPDGAKTTLTITDTQALTPQQTLYSIKHTFSTVGLHTVALTSATMGDKWVKFKKINVIQFDNDDLQLSINGIDKKINDLTTTVGTLASDDGELI